MGVGGLDHRWKEKPTWSLLLLLIIRTKRGSSAAAHCELEN